MITNSTKYAIKALLYLASRSEGDFMQVAALSESIDVPGPYLSKLMKQLGEKKLVETRRGAMGGVKLSTKNMSLLDVCEALDDPIVHAECFLNAEACNKNAPCPFHENWGKIRKQFLEFLRKSTLTKYSNQLRAILEKS